MSDFQGAVDAVLAHEGGRLVKEDNGRGPSKWGVTLATARDFFPAWRAVDIELLTKEGAAEFYRVAFWERYHLGRIEDQDLATKVFDLAVNVGPKTAIQMLQRAVGTATDGILGVRTALEANRLPAAEVLASVRELAAAHYRKLAERNPKLAAFLPGWLERLKA